MPNQQHMTLTLTQSKVKLHCKTILVAIIVTHMQMLS